MKLGTLLLQLQDTEYKIAVYDELIDHLEDEGIEIPCESGTVPLETIALVVEELKADKKRMIARLSAAEDVEVEDAQLENLGGSEATA